MIVTLTPNPSLDRTLELDRIRYGQVNRAARCHVEPSGKGVNVSRALVRNGVRSVAVLPVGGHDGDHLVELLAAEGVEHRPVPVAGNLRVNVSVLTADGTVTKVNEPGPRLAPAELAGLVDAVLTAVDRYPERPWVVGSGTLPPGAPEDFYARLCVRVHEAGARFALDTSGEALRRGLAAGPDLVKPNLPELRELAGLLGLRSVTHPGTLGEVIAAGSGIRELTGGNVLVSLGADGAVLLDGAGPLHAAAPPILGSGVGAGDALLAGFVAGFVAGPVDRTERMREAAAWASSAVRAPGSLGPPVRDAERALVEVRDGGSLGAIRLSGDRNEDHAHAGDR